MKSRGKRRVSPPPSYQPNKPIYLATSPKYEPPLTAVVANPLLSSRRLVTQKQPSFVCLGQPSAPSSMGKNATMARHVIEIGNGDRGKFGYMNDKEMSQVLHTLQRMCTEQRPLYEVNTPPFPHQFYQKGKDGFGKVAYFGAWIRTTPFLININNNNTNRREGKRVSTSG